ncbi:lysophospholipase L1-like esterase [Mycolicibacterium rhodesiae NBB3]|jgi:lysophospholipase L1-like esterase|uniref:Lysophospholipase L1-like esterase n=1 Tax=Mycolicibacterium rhodesiae (strain NBB3) TaxID=710685 RepID=G8RLC6_MYCRN|nr:SGNH/GDSL hydrolase family protein [Mycolicibacterium rhodesiae]AEV72388.1 lysophospholipase L1-like esterase [Mycolicibacterium rhodesiae NBB3]
MTSPTRRLLVVVAAVVALVGCSKSESPAPAPSSSSTVTAAPQEGSPTSAVPQDGAVRYLALGDSLSQGVGAPDEQTGAFPALLAEQWRGAGCEVELQNAGISGYTAEQVLTDEVPQIEEFQPTLITFQAGGNDIVNGVTLDQYRQNVKAVLEAATGSGARVIVLAQNEWFRSPEGKTYGDDLAAQREAFDAALIEEANAAGAEFVDMRATYKQQADDNQWVEDGIHPTPDAYAAWATELAGAVPAPCQ